MGKDILVILMIAFGLFAVIMFVLFYAYLRKYYNSKHVELDFEKDIENNKDDDGEDEIGKPAADELEKTEEEKTIAEEKPIVEETPTMEDKSIVEETTTVEDKTKVAEKPVINEQKKKKQNNYKPKGKQQAGYRPKNKKQQNNNQKAKKQQMNVIKENNDFDDEIVPIKKK